MSPLRSKRRPEPEGELRALLQARAQKLAARREADAEAEGTLAWLAELRVGDTRYALPLEQLAAAIPLRQVTPVPLARPEVVGILRHQGQVITAYSLAALLGARGWRQDPEVLLVLKLNDGRRVAFDCEETPRAFTVPAALLAAVQGADAVQDVLLPDQQTLQLIDPARLLARVERGRDGA